MDGFSAPLEIAHYAQSEVCEIQEHLETLGNEPTNEKERRTLMCHRETERMRQLVAKIKGITTDDRRLPNSFAMVSYFQGLERATREVSCLVRTTDPALWEGDPIVDPIVWSELVQERDRIQAHMEKVRLQRDAFVAAYEADLKADAEEQAKLAEGEFLDRRRLNMLSAAVLDPGDHSCVHLGTPPEFSDPQGLSLLIAERFPGFLQTDPGDRGGWGGLFGRHVVRLSTDNGQVQPLVVALVVDNVGHGLHSQGYG